MLTNNSPYSSVREIFQATQKVPLNKRVYMFDFDGTLVGFNDNPELVKLQDWQVDNIKRLYDATEGGVTIVTGRDEEFIDKALKGFRLPASFEHGVYLREKFDGPIKQCTGDIDLDLLKQCIDESYGVHHPYDLRLEGKSHGAAFHFIASNQPKNTMEPVGRAVAFSTCRFYNERTDESREKLKYVAGHLVFEINPLNATKENAVRDLMQLEQFKDRTPIYAGDQPADQGAVDLAIGRFGGIGIARGLSITKPTFRLESPSDIQEIIDMDVRAAQTYKQRVLAL